MCPGCANERGGQGYNWVPGARVGESHALSKKNARAKLGRPLKQKKEDMKKKKKEERSLLPPGPLTLTTKIMLVKRVPKKSKTSYRPRRGGRKGGTKLQREGEIGERRRMRESFAGASSRRK